MCVTATARRRRRMARIDRRYKVRSPEQSKKRLEALIGKQRLMQSRKGTKKA